MADKKKTITLKSNLGNNRAALWERHPDHPTGEIFVAGDRVVKAALTAQVQAALSEGRVMQVASKTTTKGKKE